MYIAIWIVPFGIAGFLAAMFFTWGASGDGWQLMSISAGIASALVGVLVWAGLARGRIPGIGRGAVMGGLVGLLSHPVTWYLAILYNFFWGTPSLPGDVPLGPVDGINGSLALSFWSVLVAGWLTVPLAAGLGAFIAWRFGKKHFKQSETDRQSELG